MNVAIIPARGGSKRLPRKNIRMFHGKPIIAYSIEAARMSQLFGRVIVSTEDDEIAAVAHSYSAEVLRRTPDLADDLTGTTEVTGRALYALGEPVVLACCIYPTAPMLLPDDLVTGRQVLLASRARYAFSIGTHPKLHDAGMFYWGYPDCFEDGLPIFDVHTQMVPIPANRVCDINTEDDWQRAERMYAELHRVAA